MPHLIIIAGSNGAGKSAEVNLLLRKKKYGKNFWRHFMKNKQDLIDDNISKILNDPVKETQVIQA